MRTWFDDSATGVSDNKSSWMLAAARRLVQLGLISLLPLLLGAECGLEPCEVFNCDTLPFMEDFSWPNGEQDDHDDMDGMDDDMDDHADMDGMDDDVDDHDDMDDHMDDDIIECSDLGSTPTKASEWIDFVDWDEATRVEMMAHEVSEDSFHFMPDHLEFEAGKPYILVMQSSEDNEEKHYFHAPGTRRGTSPRAGESCPCRRPSGASR